MTTFHSPFRLGRAVPSSVRCRLRSSSSIMQTTTTTTTTTVSATNKHFDDQVAIKSFAHIPAARRLPLVGTKLDFVLAGAGKKLHEYVDARHRTLGPVFREALGPVDMVFVSCPTAMRQLFKYEGRHPKHPLPDAWTMYNEAHQSKRGLFFMDDDEWLHNRKIINTLMLTADSQRPWSDVILQTCDDLLADWSAMLLHNPTESVEIPDLINALYTWSVRGVSAVVLGSVAGAPQLHTLIGRLSRMLPELFECSAPLMSFPPAVAKRWNLRIWRDFERTVTDILAVANRIGDVALLELKRDGGAGEVSSLMAGMLRNGMPDDVIKRIFIDLILAAGDTTAYTMQWALYLLARDQHTQQQVRDDIQRHPAELDAPLVRGTVRETMRLYPVAYIIGRLMASDAVIADYAIPRNTMVLSSLYTAGRTEANFPEALDFQPGRWSRDASGKYVAVTKPGASIPYAMGARSCVGQRLANTQMHCMLTRLVQRFELRLLNDRAVDVSIKMVMVPSQTIRIGIRKIQHTVTS